MILFHEGLGSQEGIFGELKTDCQMGHIPVTTRVGNQLYLFADVLVHNLTRELQMQIKPPSTCDHGQARCAVALSAAQHPAPKPSSACWTVDSSSGQAGVVDGSQFCCRKRSGAIARRDQSARLRACFMQR